MAFRSIVTPEAVELRTRIAGLGSRFAAAAIDSIVIGLIVLALFFIGMRSGPSEAVGVTLFIVVLLLVWGYMPFFEIVWSGQTPGKRAQGIRVVRADGSPVTVGAALLRNLFRLVDMLPTMYIVGVITMLVDGQSRRVGDIVAGTLVVHDAKPIAPSDVVLSPQTESAAASIDASGLDHRDYATIRSYLERRSLLKPDARIALASTIASAVRSRIGRVPPLDDDALLEAVASAYRRRFGG